MNRFGERETRETRRRAWLVSSLALLLSACGGPVESKDIEEQGSLEAQSSELKNGALFDGGAQWLGAIRLKAWSASLNQWVPCTGQIVSRRTVITAAHCVSNSLSNSVTSGTILVIIDRETSSGVFNSFAAWAFTKYHPSWDVLNSSRDIATITIPNDFANLTWSEVPYIMKTTVSDQPMWAVGYGHYDVGANDVDWLGRSGKVSPAFNSSRHDYYDSPGVGEATLCRGDSGGPIKLVASPSQLYGVLSRGDIRLANDKCGTKGSYWASTSENWAWLQAAIGYGNCSDLGDKLDCW